MIVQLKVLDNKLFHACGNEKYFYSAYKLIGEILTCKQCSLCLPGALSMAFDIGPQPSKFSYRYFRGWADMTEARDLEIEV